MSIQPAFLLREIFLKTFQYSSSLDFGSFPLTVQNTKYIDRRFSFGGRVSYCKITKYYATSIKEQSYNTDAILIKLV